VAGRTGRQGGEFAAMNGAAPLFTGFLCRAGTPSTDTHRYLRRKISRAGERLFDALCMQAPEAGWQQTHGIAFCDPYSFGETV
jgi:hypothetical protein